MSDTPRTDWKELLRTLLNKAHTVGQDDYRENASYSSIARHDAEFRLAQENFEQCVQQLERELAALTEANLVLTGAQSDARSFKAAYEAERAAHLSAREAMEKFRAEQQPDIDALVKNEGRLFKANAELRKELAEARKALAALEKTGSTLANFSDPVGCAAWWAFIDACGEHAAAIRAAKEGQAK